MDSIMGEKNVDTEPSKIVDLTELGKVVLPNNIDTVLKKFRRKKDEDDSIALMIHNKRRRVAERPGYKDKYKFNKKNVKWRTHQKRMG